MRPAPLRRLLLAVLVSGLGGACGGGGDDEGGGDGAPVSEGGVPVEAKEFAFVPAEVTAAAGEVIFSLKNTGTQDHNLSIDEPKFSVTALAGRTRSRKVKMTAGTYEIYCKMPGHKAAGMEGKVTVN